MQTKLPAILKHTTMAIYDSDYLHVSGGPQRFEAAFNIARARLVEYGYLTKGSETGAVEKIGLTGKGQVRERHHKFGEGRDTTRKNAAFDALYVKTFQKAADKKAAEAKSKEKTTQKSMVKPPPHAMKDKAHPVQSKQHGLKAETKDLQPEKVPLKSTKPPSSKDQF